MSGYKIWYFHGKINYGSNECQTTNMLDESCMGEIYDVKYYNLTEKYVDAITDFVRVILFEDNLAPENVVYQRL